MDEKKIEISDLENNEKVEKADNENNNSKNDIENYSKETLKYNENNNIICEDINNDNMNELVNNLRNYINNISKNSIKIENNIKNNIQEEKVIEDNIILEYLENKNILKYKDKLISFIDELSTILSSGNNNIIPFLDLCPNLLKAYIDSNLDEEKGNTELKYIKIFQLLKYNSFISREYLYYIYDYFAHLYYIMNTIEEDNKIFKKFNKMIELLNLFYTFSPENETLIKSKKSHSSFCFLGGGLKFEFKEKILPKDIITIYIIFYGNISTKLNKNLTFLRWDDGKNNFKIDFSNIEEDVNKFNFPKSILIIFYPEEIGFSIKWQNQENINSNPKFKREFGSFEEFYFLENFYGQIESLEVQIERDLKKNSGNSGVFIVKPYLLSNNCVYYDDSMVQKLKIINPKLVKVNYINYLETNFDIYNYFLGIKQALPLIPLINGIYKNSKIKNINDKDKTEYLRNIISNLLFKFTAFISDKKKIEKNKDIIIIEKKPVKKNEKNFEEEKQKLIKDITEKAHLLRMNKYTRFILNAVLQLPLELLYGVMRDLYHQFEEKCMNIFINTDTMYAILNAFSNYQDKEDFLENLKSELFTNYENDFVSIKGILHTQSYEQLYRKIMKELFIYNRFWSVKEFFFNINKDDNNNKNDDDFNNFKLKYKQISYYTKSFEQPFLYPILELNEYIPNFSKFDKNNLFQHDYNLAVNYDFNLQKTDVIDIINEKEPYFNENLKLECCLVKEGYHVKGKIILKPIDIDKNTKDYYFIFSSFDKEVETLCNKKPKNKKHKRPTDTLCFGSLFHAPKREFRRKIFLKMEDINLILIRNYFKGTSAIEIFTTKKNKSYFFNFNSLIYQKNVIKNPIVKAISECPHFQRIKMNNEKKNINYLEGFYNISRENLIFSLFSEEFPYFLSKNIKLFNRYDLLILINLLSNRSFKDLYQYPVFPILYNKSKILDNETKKERDLSQHLGLQDISKSSFIRRQFIKGMEESIDIHNKGVSKSNLFEIHYSNPIYTSNYLIRIFPYSLTCIEFQGDGFDSPNRLLYSIQKSLENTLTQKSDLREFIPEMYSFPDLFFNKNEIKLGTLTNGEEIDNIIIEDSDEPDFAKYKYLEECKNYFLGDENLELNSWIDLIFGINQEKNKEDGRNYYSKEKYINLNVKKQKDEISKEMNLEVVEFGVQPIKIFDEKFPDLSKQTVSTTNQYYQGLINYNLFEFYNSHLIVRNEPDVCFKLDWDENSKMMSYIKVLTENSDIREDLNPNINVYYNYSFEGNVLGDIVVYKTKMIKDQKENNFEDFSGKVFFTQTNKNHQNEDNICYSIKKVEDENKKVLKKLSDHYKQIAYIDYNPRLNLFLSYGLDGYINIYVFPKCKLIRTIKVSDITKSDNVLKKVVLVSSPFPMIFFHDSQCMYVLSINGDFINKKEFGKNVKLYSCIDKNFGLIRDTIFLLLGTGNNDKNVIVGMKSATLPSLEFV